MDKALILAHLAFQILTGTFTGVGGAPATVATPTDSPGAGSYSSTQSVTLSDATGSAVICYRTDGTNPAATTPGTCDAGSTTYSGAFNISTTSTLKALGTKVGLVNSGILTSVYTIGGPAKTIIAHGKNQGSGAGSTFTIPLNCTGATGYAVGISAYQNTVTGVTVTDLESNTYTHFTQAIDGSNQSAVNWYYVLNITGNSSEVFSITADYAFADAVCFTGSSLVIDGNTSTNTACITGATPYCVLPTITPTGSGDLMLLMSSMNVATTTFMAAGSLIDPGSYVSGITANCSAPQTCVLSSFNGGGSGATATVACSGINTLVGQALTITGNGSGYTSPPTTATVSAGTAASCTGTPVLSTTVSYPLLLDQATVNAGVAYGGAAYAKIKTDSSAEAPTVATTTSASLGAAVMLIAIK